ncbi:hypothetical protein ABK040_004297 [Willaertia magna]
MQLGEGYTIEGQVTGEENVGGVQVICYRPKENERLKKFPKITTPLKKKECEKMSKKKMCLSSSSSSLSAPRCRRSAKSEAKELGIAAGGRIKQDIVKDAYGEEFWDVDSKARIFIHIVNSEMYRQITGENPPNTPVSAQTYSSYNYPWFDWYNENLETITKSEILENVKSVSEIDKEKYGVSLQNNTTVKINNVKVIKDNYNPNKSNTNITVKCCKGLGRKNEKKRENRLHWNYFKEIQTGKFSTSFSLLPPEIINHILDYSSYTSHDNIHPFALVSKTTRNCWLNHYLSTPYKLITNLIELVNVNNKTFPLDYKLSYFNYLKQVLKTTKVPLKKENERLIEIENKKAQLEIDKINRVQLINRIKQFNLTEIELKEIENIINNHCVDIIITVDDHYEGDILCYFLYTIEFEIHDINFSSTFTRDVDMDQVES